VIKSGQTVEVSCDGRSRLRVVLSQNADGAWWDTDGALWNLTDERIVVPAPEDIAVWQAVGGGPSTPLCESGATSNSAESLRIPPGAEWQRGPLSGKWGHHQAVRDVYERVRTC